jgi:membrane protease YdiL (CAAX protease family)
LAFAAATALSAALYWIGQAVPLVQRNLGGLVALVFLGIAIHLLDRRREPLSRYGITWRPPVRGLAWGLGATVVVLGLFMVGYHLYFEAVCGQGATLLGPLGRPCARWAGSNLALGLPPRFAEQVLGQLLVVAIPEEIFYRGYLLGRLERALPARRALWGVPIGSAMLLQAALFGLGHFLMDFNPLRLGVAVPALAFAFLRHKGGSIVAPVLFHAAANLLMLVVDSSYFP